ncbi:MAG TPA: polysaccharide deacetylase family protein [Chitinophagaceae bacterium]|nr:polysaccharide deacetylase family protein [Chitinophagaceae bacterium]
MNFKQLKYYVLPAFFLLSFFTFAGKIPVWILFLSLFFIINTLVIGSIFIQYNFYIHSICSVQEFPDFKNSYPDEKRICLTFDDGIHRINTPKTLQILKEKNVKAHFFLIGKNIIGNEDILREMQHEQHVIGNHSYYHHWNFDLQSSEQMLSEIIHTNQLIEKTIKQKITLFRPPYGVTNPNLSKAIQQSNLKSMGWNLRSMDTTAKSKEKLLQKLIRKTKPNCIVLLHERCDLTVEVLTEYIEYCQQQGYKFVTLNS